MRRLRRRARTDAHGTDDAGFVVVLALLLILLLSTFSLLVLAQVSEEVRQTQFNRKHEQTLNTALAGFGGALSRIRNSVTTSTGIGAVSALPCTNGASVTTLSGAVDLAGARRWSVNAYYTSVDPRGLTAPQVATAALTCPLTSVPAFVYLVSAGTQDAYSATSGVLGDRTLHAVYPVSTLATNASGGQVSFGGNCWDAGSSPADGSSPTFQPCATAGSPSQSWLYRPDMSMFWAGDPSLNLCLDYRTLPTAFPVAYVTLRTCLGSGLPGTAFDSISGAYPVAGQQFQEFSSNDNWNAVAANGDQGNSCVQSYSSGGVPALGATGDRLIMSSACHIGADYASGTAGVGAGAAGGISTGFPGPTEQLVTSSYNGRCLDVNGGNPANGLITYPCHQTPDLAKTPGNQRFVYEGSATSPGLLSTTSTTNFGYPKSCFESSGITLKVQTCTGDTAQQWQLTGYVSGNVSRSYTVVDYTGRCMTTSGGSIGSISIATCTGSAKQKWNAPATSTPKQLDGVGE